MRIPIREERCQAVLESGPTITARSEISCNRTTYVRQLLAKLQAPLTDRFVRHDDTADEQQFFRATMAEAEVNLQPESAADALARKPNPTESCISSSIRC